MPIFKNASAPTQDEIRKRLYLERYGFDLNPKIESITTYKLNRQHKEYKSLLRHIKILQFKKKIKLLLNLINYKF